MALDPASYAAQLVNVGTWLILPLVVFIGLIVLFEVSYRALLSRRIARLEGLLSVSNSCPLQVRQRRKLLNRYRRNLADLNAPPYA